MIMLRYVSDSLTNIKTSSMSSATHCGPKYWNGDLRQARGNGRTSVFSIKQHSLCDDGDIETAAAPEYLFNMHAFKTPGKFRQLFVPIQR